MTGRATITQRAFERFARGMFRCYCPLRVTGRDWLPPLPFILCSNHTSHMDSVALMTATGLPFERFGLVAASDYFFRNALVYRWFSGMVQLIPITRSAKGAAIGRTVEMCRDFVAAGDRGLIVFPEGTRSVTGAMAPFKRGIAFISTELGLPIVPAYIEGSRTRMPKGRVFPAPGTVSVHFGAPFLPGGERDHDALARAVEDRIRALEDGVR